MSTFSPNVSESALNQAIAFAVAHETAWSRDTETNWGIHQQDPAPWNKLLGPVHARGPVSGTVLFNGKLLTSWGEPQRADLTFSVAKTYLALIAGVAFDDGLIPSVDATIGSCVRGIGFDNGANARITWAHMLQQVSEWEGECFGMPDQVERYRKVQFQTHVAQGIKGEPRPLQAPGTYWEYNDVRINQLSLALLHLFGKPLPDVFRERIMRPIGASEAWQWQGYDHAWVTLKNQRAQSVPGGSHWGGGVSISSADQARIGQLLLDEGQCNGKQVLSRDWVQRMRVPCAIAPFYGYLVWLNSGRKVFPSVSESSYFAFGAGSSFTWIEPEHRMVLVVRWIDADFADEFFGRVLAAINK